VFGNLIRPVSLAIEEVNLFKEDGSVIHFANPRFQVAGGANMYVVSGKAENKKIQDILPGILKSGAERLVRSLFVLWQFFNHPCIGCGRCRRR